jgi:gluconolactonase
VWLNAYNESVKSAAPALLALACLCSAQETGQHLIQRVASGFRYADGLAIEQAGSLLVADPPEDRIVRIVFGKPPAVVRKPSGGAAGLAFDPKGRLVICETEARRVVRIEEDGALTVLAREYEGKPLNGPNDLVIRSNGHIYFTDPAFGSANERRQLPFHGVFHVNPKGDLEAVYRSESRPSGIALSPDERTLYVTFADERLVRAFDVSRAGAVSNPRVLIAKTGSIPLGVRTDRDGNLLVAAGEFLEIYAAKGTLIEKIRLPDRVANFAVHPSTGDIYAATRSAVHLVARGARAALQP